MTDLTDAPATDRYYAADRDRTTTVLKLGGSVITEKTAPETINEGSLGHAADAIASHLEADGTPTAKPDEGADGPTRLMLVHGGGSFGHYHADDHGVSVTAGTRDARAVHAIHDAMGELNDRVIDALCDRGVPALPVHPLSVGARDEAGELDFPTAAIEGMCAEEFVPVCQADVLVQAGAGATILSGDEIVTALATRLGADRVGLCSAVPGVFDGDGEVIERIDSIDAVGAHAGESDATDVTGGMRGKVTQLLSIDAPASIFGLDALEGFLAGGSPGTLVAGRSE